MKKKVVKFIHTGHDNTCEKCGWDSDNKKFIKKHGIKAYREAMEKVR